MSKLAAILRGERPPEPPEPKATSLYARLASMPAPTVSPWTIRTGPRMSPDFVRVRDLPRRPLDSSLELAERMTARLRRPGGTWRLRPIQAAALADAEKAGGLVGLVGVGHGKTLISLLLPTVFDAKVTVLLVPPQLRSQLLERDFPELSKHWRLPNLAPRHGGPHYPDAKGVLHVVAYSELSGAKSGDILERIYPDLVVADEAHSLRNASAARTKRFRRYFKVARQGRPANDDRAADSRVFRCRLAVLSGTLTSRSVRDYAHLTQLALGTNSPLPIDWPILQEWSWALDASPVPSSPGVLEQLCGPGESVRQGFRRRLVETPGVVATDESQIGTSLVFSERPLKVPEAVEKALAELRKTWTRPDGEELVDALSFTACARQLATGMWYRWRYPKNEPLALRKEWLECRAAWNREVRERLKLSIPGQDSPLLCWNAAESGKWRAQSFEAWKEIKNAVEPETETVWIDKFAVEDAVKWANEAPGILWVEHEAVGAAFEIAERAEIKFYGGGAQASADILNEKGNRSIVASIKAHGTGKNLQAFSRNLVLTPSSSGALWEQLVGRTHRQGQQADDVTVEMYRHSCELRAAVKSARDAARYVEATTGSAQKLLYGSWTFDPDA